MKMLLVLVSPSTQKMKFEEIVGEQKEAVK
jgi:hypothetical protein